MPVQRSTVAPRTGSVDWNTVGLFDKDTKKQEHDTAEAQALVNNYVASHFDGATVYSCDGVYKHADGTTVREPSIRVELCYTEREKVIEFAQWAKKILNQESIMLEEVKEEIDFIWNRPGESRVLFFIYIFYYLNINNNTNIIIIYWDIKNSKDLFEIVYYRDIIEYL